MGEISSDGTVSRGALSYALGSNGGYSIKNDAVRNIYNIIRSNF